MFRTAASWIATLSVTLFVGQALAQDKTPPKGADLEGFLAASATVEAFLKGISDGDIEAVMATVDVPWFDDGTKILRSEDQLRDLLSEPIREKELIGLNAEINEVLSFASLRDKATGSAGELLKQVANDKDLVFLMKVTVGRKTDDMMLLVRVNDGKARIIGLRD